MSQCDQILHYMRRGNSITALTALTKFGCLRLAARVADLRARGNVIVSHRVETASGKHVARYSLLRAR